MEPDISNLTVEERNQHKSLSDALGITVEELLQLSFHNENIFDAGGIAKEVRFVFEGSNPTDILHKIKGLEADNSTVLSTGVLNFPV